MLLKVARLLTAVFGVLSGVAAAHGMNVPMVDYPHLPARTDTVAQLVPPGWRLETQVQGDLNKDGIADRVLVLHDDDPGNLARHKGLGENPLNSNPRILAVAFGRTDGGYTLALENHTLIPRWINPVLEDPFDGVAAGGVTIEYGTLQVTLGRFSNAGSWEMGHSTFTFRWRDGDFRLIGYDSMSVIRSTGAMETLSINYLTSRAKHTQGSTDSDKETVSWTRVRPAPLLRFDDVGDGLAFDPENRS